MPQPVSLNELVSASRSGDSSARAGLATTARAIAGQLAVALVSTDEAGLDPSTIAEEAAVRFIAAISAPEFVVSTSAEQLSREVRRSLFSCLAANYHDRLVPWIRSKLNAAMREESEDVWQEVCRVLDRNCARYEWRNDKQFLGLLRRIAQRKVWDFHKRRGSPGKFATSPHVADSSVAGLVEEFAADTSTPAKLTWREERRQLLMQSLEGVLAPGEREIVRLRFIELRSVEDTARAVNKSPGAVKMATQRALARLRQHLGSSFGRSTF